MTWKRRNSELSNQLGKLKRERQQLVDERDWEIFVSTVLAELYSPLISAESTIQEMADLVLDKARRLTDSAHGYVATVDPSTGRGLVYAATRAGRDSSIPTELRDKPFPLPPAVNGVYPGLRGHSLNTGKSFCTNAVREHPAFLGHPDWHVAIERFLSVPVMLDGRPAGQIALANPPHKYRVRHLRAIERLAEFYALALQHKEAQDQILDALREKEVLLREIHHRVKNNLQVISSLLNLQTRNLEDPVTREMLKESQNRVRSMAMVHEQLHRSRALSRINFAEYVRNLTASLFCSYGIDSSRVTLNLDITDVCLPIDMAVPCGLIIQELVSNSLKHAFPDGRGGEVRISLGHNAGAAPGTWQLVVSDNGVGLPVSVEPDTSNSLGLRLVRMLTEQLEGSFCCRSGPGTEFRIDLINQ